MAFTLGLSFLCESPHSASGFFDFDGGESAVSGLSALSAAVSIGTTTRETADGIEASIQNDPAGADREDADLNVGADQQRFNRLRDRTSMTESLREREAVTGGVVSRNS